MDVATCPWDGFDAATISFCEARLCGWIVEPANAWTSLSKTLVGLALIPACWRARRPALWAIASTALLQGPLGFSLHATGTFWGEALDVCGMFLISGLLITFALARLRGWGSRRLITTYVALTACSAAALFLFRPSGIWVFSAQLVGWAILEVLHARRTPDADRRWLWRMVACFALGFGFWLADKTGLACDPANHLLNGHALWHLATSACLALFFKFETGHGDS